jgi:hypothetical protein
LINTDKDTSSNSNSNSISNRNSINSDSNSNSNGNIDTIMDHVYNQEIVPISCSIIEKYALLPLHPTFIDKLLDRIANIISMQELFTKDELLVEDDHDGHDYDDDDDHGKVEESVDAHHHQSQRQRQRHQHQHRKNEQTQHLSQQHCSFLSMIQIVNTSLLAQDQMQAQMQTKNDNNHKTNNGLLLNANETIALTQLLIPLSLKHLSHSWEFVIRTCHTSITDATATAATAIFDTTTGNAKSMNEIDVDNGNNNDGVDSEVDIEVSQIDDIVYTHDQNGTIQDEMMSNEIYNQQYDTNDYDIDNEQDHQQPQEEHQRRQQQRKQRRQQ